MCLLFLLPERKQDTISSNEVVSLPDLHISLTIFSNSCKEYVIAMYYDK